MSADEVKGDRPPVDPNPQNKEIENEKTVHAYWWTADPVAGQRDTLKTSVYLRQDAGKALVLTTNMDDEAQYPGLRVDAAALGFAGELAFSNPETGDAVDATNSADGKWDIQIAIPGRDYRALLVEMK